MIPTKRRLKVLSGLFALLGVAGFVDATYLTVKHFIGTPIACSIFNGCDTVTTSVYSQIGPVPVALLGALYYLTLIILGVYVFDTGSKLALKIAAAITGVGFLFSIILVYIQIFILGSICLYCVISAVVTTLMFILAIVILRDKKYEVIGEKNYE
ncbi:MAG: hypothetical protein A3G52_01785 [Candidatus Taylorbacteria bacterium RIFCSPLOWO2_12_FULL_43_20]|uniref:Vitamin K epoxide reductase domain-containing protein n=1 Tax=Candidatus Taylorbacteria bacterium RIFCSPLOWO2_12_FULL_43_20 TaxID=1802332 RepID=A0A1G2P0X5_9BACT|nr:MAG: hypothetical protein A3B98_00270 [Candidatus Taylorbacteria bacterium RIFCSPHIGHO2_02_FULL_43_55]OHA29933.1 MAG: hypothetical protein A3E92_03900 [Candidatus Taylorbacteria bacterium RIFCSPHIGHO2_12_FULL_42_34]OHA30565.1 MAG: hypothetical protein A3B09_01520 [Candidatus Taylorbacteria bacterium RIFCSPLOWO2_01_FULL_43_83]OHA38397.1 MAG: hypothetical protein A3H58_04325 [Candidatus Taylorbacteria bacterium RIFCSPLOWO2_02_FULL_43_22b]OHA42005.1 MAG: hypothetical protein A3G52_01785 [Candid